MKRLLVIISLLVCSSCGLVYDTYDFFNERYFNRLEGKVDVANIDLKNVPKEWFLKELKGDMTFFRCTTNTTKATRRGMSLRKNLLLGCGGEMTMNNQKYFFSIAISGNKEKKDFVKLDVFIPEKSNANNDLVIKNILSGEYEIVSKTDKELSLKKIRNLDKQFPDFLITINGIYQTK